MTKNKSTTGNNSDWIQSARIRFTQLAPQFYGVDYAKREIEITRRYHFNTLAFFVEMDGWLIYPSRHAPMEKTIGNTDLFGEIARECEKENIRLIACWMGKHCQTYHLQRHKEWLCRHYSSHFPRNPFPPGAEGEQEYILCLNSPFRHTLLGEVEEVLRNYAVAGVYFDGIYRMPGYCYCRYCQKEFERQYNRAIPGDINDRDWRRFINDYTADFSRDAKKLIEQISPGTQLFQDCHGALIGTYDSQENIRDCSKFVDSFILESYHEHSGEAPTFVAMESQLVRAESNKPVSHARWLTYSPGHINTAIPESSVLVWAYDVPATGGIPVGCDQGGFWYDRSLEKPLGDFMSHMAQFQDVLAESMPIKHVALLHSLACKDQRMPHDNRSARAYFEGFYLALEQNHIPFSILTEQDILNGRLREYAAVVLPNVEFMDDTVARRIEKFSNSGGGVVATYRTSFCTAGGETRNKPALAELLGIGKINGFFSRGAKMATVKYDAVVLTEPANLFEIVSNHPAAESLSKERPYSFAGAAVDMLPASGWTTVARLRNYDKQWAATGRFFRWMPAELAQNIVIAREDKNKTVYIAGALDRAYWEFGYPFAATLLSQSVAWAAARENPVKIEASPLIAARTRYHGGKNILTIHLTNYAVNQIFLPGFAGSFLANPQSLSRSQKVQQISPESNIKIRIKADNNVNIRAFTGQNLIRRKKGRDMEITVPLIKEGEIIIIEGVSVNNSI